MAHAPNHYAQVVQEIIERVLRQPTVAHDVAALAAAAGIPSVQLAWLFHGMVGEAIDAFVRRICLERAVAQLVRTDRPLQDIGQEVGFRSLADFENAFKAAFTSSPRLFRRLRTPRFELPASCGIHYDDGLEPALFLPVDSQGHLLDVLTRFQPPMALAAAGPVIDHSDVDVHLQQLRRELSDAGLVSPSPLSARGFILHHLDSGGALAASVAIELASLDPLPRGRIVTVPGGRVASTMVSGREPSHATWWRLLGEWLPRSQERLRDAPLLERILDDVRPSGHAGRRTELLLPIA